MRSGFLSTIALMVGMIIAPVVAHAGGQFNLRTLSGAYAIRLSGWNMAVPISPVAIIGAISANRGALSGSIDVNTGGQNCSTTLARGSAYTVNSDGTGTMTLLLTGNADCSTGSMPIGNAVLGFTVVNNGFDVDFGTISTSPATMVLSGSAAFVRRIK